MQTVSRCPYREATTTNTHRRCTLVHEHDGEHAFEGAASPTRGTLAAEYTVAPTPTPAP